MPSLAATRRAVCSRCAVMVCTARRAWFASTADPAQMESAVKGGGHGAQGTEHHSFTGVRMGAPLPFSSTTTNLAGSVLLALRPTT